MTRIVKPKRSRGPVKRIDLTDMRTLFRDRRMWSAVGIVTKPDGADSHYEIVQDGDASIAIIVEVITQPSLEDLSCRLLGGMFDIPDEGDEVAILIPEGERDFMPIVVGRLARSVPTEQGPQPGRIVIVRDEVFVHDGNGGAKALATVDHFHLDSTGSPTDTPITTAIPNIPNPSFPSPDSVNPFLDENGMPTTKPFHNGAADGTTVLKAK